MTVDTRNAEFWNELCGTTMARAVGVTSRSPEDLRRFDGAFLAFYPYLDEYLPASGLNGSTVLEIGLGYGTLGTLLMDRGADYTGVDIAPGPVEMMRYRIDLAADPACHKAEQASALDLPFEDEAFDLVYAIGSLHHTGDLERSVAEVWRVLRPGGRAVVMIYNGRSVRRLLSVPRRATARVVGRQGGSASERARYDANSNGEAAPHTDFLSARRVRDMFARFVSVEIDRRNITIPHLPAARLQLLSAHADRLVGLDLYVRATR